MVKDVLLALPGWLLQIVLQVPLMLLGFPLIAFAAWMYAYWGSNGGRGPLQWKWRWMWLYGNDENGIDGAYGSLPNGWPHSTWPKWLQIFVWSAWRNSVGNARRTSLFGMTVVPDVVVRDYWGSVAGLETLKEGPYLVHQGWRYELRFCWTPKRPDWTTRRYFWIGWRIAQCTVDTPDVGFACQPWMKI